MDSRESIVRAHIDSECRHAFEETIRTFHHPRYEVVPTGDRYDGPEEVAAFFRETHVAFPDFRFDVHAMHHGDHAVIVELTFVGTHRGSWRGLPATGRSVSYRMCAVYVFEEDRLICERLYFDLLSILKQLGVGRDPTSLWGRVMLFFNHPCTVGAALLRRLFGS